MRRVLHSWAALFLLAGCASSPPDESTFSPLLERGESRKVVKSQPWGPPPPPPAWVSSPPKGSGVRYFVGEAHSSDREDALERAWTSAFVRIGMTQFPEVAKLRSESRESLKDTEYERRLVLQLERIDWTGVREAADFKSPHVAFDPKRGVYDVYRLVKWSDSELEAARKKIHEPGKYPIPGSPEAAEGEEVALIDHVHHMKRISRRIADRDSFVDKVLKEARCGVTISDLRHILGKPDRDGPYNYESVEQKFYWGTFEVTHFRDEPLIFTIKDANGQGEQRLLCRPKD